jgi:hypothetical protein
MLFAAVIAGLAAGIAFIFVMTVMADTAPATMVRVSAIRTAGELDEVKTFREVYPNSNVTVFFNSHCLSCRPPIVEYGYQEGTEYTNIRVILTHSNEVIFKAVACINLENTFDSVDVHGQNLERRDILDLLKDPHCP